MQKVLLFFTCSVLFLLGKAQEKTTSTIEQTFVFEPRYLDSINQVHSLKIEPVKLFSYEQVFKISNYILVDSIHSINEIKGSPNIRILIKLNPTAFTDNPKNYFKLFLMEVDLKDNLRKCQINATKHFVNAKTNYNLGLPIQYTLMNDNNIQLTFENLSKGEYLIKVVNTYYTFSVI